MAVHVRGVRLEWDSGGATTAPPLIWGHGLTSSRASEDRFPLVDLQRVRERFTVVRYDAHGHGETSALSDAERGSWRELALDQVALVDYLGIEEVILGGASMGAATALHAALELGERVRGLLLVIPPTGWEERAAQVSIYDQMASIVETKGVEPLVSAAAATAPPDPFVGTTDWAEHRAASMRGTDPTRLAANLRGAAHADLPPRESLASLSIPTLVLAWSGDPGHPVSTALHLAETLPHCELIVSNDRASFAAWTHHATQFLASVTTT